MSLSAVSLEVATDAKPPRWMLAPSAQRVDGIDAELRLQLAASLAYLVDVAPLDGERRDVLSRLGGKLKVGPVSPWVFCLYSKLVAELTGNARSDAAQTIEAIARAVDHPAGVGVLPFLDSGIEGVWWDHFRVLLDTDPKRPFKPRACGEEAFRLCKQEIEAALALMQRADPAFHDEVRRLLRTIVLGAPESSDLNHVFNGASTFFLWGATLLNADLRRTIISIVALLVHESSHVLLFGLSAQSALTRNSGDERYASPLRTDARPIDGIFHACFVATRVHLALNRLIESGMLNPEEIKQAVRHRDHNGNAARVALSVLDEHARPTELGKELLQTIRTYLE
jgi:hypothetical protein